MILFYANTNTFMHILTKRALPITIKQTKKCMKLVEVAKKPTPLTSSSSIHTQNSN